jgi:hypothetical protein
MDIGDWQPLGLARAVLDAEPPFEQQLSLSDHYPVSGAIIELDLPWVYRAAACDGSGGAWRVARRLDAWGLWGQWETCTTPRTPPPTPPCAQSPALLRWSPSITQEDAGRQPEGGTLFGASDTPRVAALSLSTRPSSAQLDQQKRKEKRAPGRTRHHHHHHPLTPCHAAQPGAGRRGWHPTTSGRRLQPSGGGLAERENACLPA